MSVTVGEGLVTRACTNSVEKTLEQLEGMLRAKGVTIFAVVDHSGEAAKVGLTMRPTKLLIGNQPGQRGETPAGRGVAVIVATSLPAAERSRRTRALLGWASGAAALTYAVELTPAQSGSRIDERNGGYRCTSDAGRARRADQDDDRR
jgi:hypothetical protein